MLFCAICLSAAPTLLAQDSADMAAFKKQIEAQLSEMKTQYEGRIKGLEERVVTLEADNQRLRREGKTSAPPATAEITEVKERLAALESTTGKPSPEAQAAAKRSTANAAAIEDLQQQLQESATETRDIYRNDMYLVFDDAKFYDLARPFEFHGYLRSGFGMNGEGGKMDAFRAPGAGAKYRLGNEDDTYGELSLVNNWLRLDEPTLSPYVRSTVTLSYSTGENFSYDSLNKLDQGNDIALREAYVVGGNVFTSHPEIRFWGGQRYYRRHDIHINDFYYLDMSGYGGGVEDVPIGEIGKMALAWIGGSVDDYATNNGDVAKQNIDLRLYDIGVPLGKMTLWFDYSNTKGGDVRNVFDPAGNPISVESSSGWAVGLIHRTLEEKLWGGYNEFSIQYGSGAAYNFASTLDVSSPHLDDASRFRVTDQLTIQPSPHFAMQAVAIFEDTDYGGPESSETWTSFGVRPIYFFNDRFSIALEAGVDIVNSEPQDADGHLWKITLAPQLSRGGKFFSRPVLRPFITYAKWSDDFRGRVGGDAYENATSGWSYGLQVEAWW
jgi:maltoporin